MADKTTSTTLRNAIARFRDEVYAHTTAIDPNGNYNWLDIARGFLLACGVPREELSWEVLVSISRGEFDKYLGAPLTPEEWVDTVFAANPECVSVRVGYGWSTDNDPASARPTVWMDFVTNTGEHMASSQDKPLITIPDNVTDWVIDNVTLGEWVDYARKP